MSKKAELTHEEKINYMRIACNIAGFGFNEKHTDSLVCIYENVISKGGAGSLEDIAKIETQVKKRADSKKRKQLLDEVSEAK